MKIKTFCTFCIGFLLASAINMQFTLKIEASDNIISTYTTEFGSWDKPRTNNIMLATKAIDNTIIKSGGTFSFNDIVGKRTAERGYLESTIFVYDDKVKGIGGGICQVSTTLYNTALYANMDIIERHSHKREIYYAPSGRDATVSYGTLDFKFKNNRPYDILVRAYTTGNKLTIELRQV